jgi:fumarylacetoacetase
MSNAPAKIDPTMNPLLKSWVESANSGTTDFPIQNLPLGLHVSSGKDEEGEFDNLQMVVAIGDYAVDLDMLVHGNALGTGDAIDVLHAAAHSGNANIMAEHPEFWPTVRQRIQAWLLDGGAGGQTNRRLREKALIPLSEANLMQPMAMPNYTDFYASVHHATNVGSMFRPDNPLLPNYKHVPIGYHGRASTIVPSGTSIRRPKGQTKPEGSEMPVFGPSKRLDYEMELGCVIGGVNELGTPVGIDKAHERIFGFVLVNDWSARDVQAWEYQPLGPFLAKNFATTVSPWLVTRDVVEHYRVAGPARGAGDPEVLEYLRAKEAWGLDLTVEVWLSSQKMRKAKMPAIRLSKGNLQDMYWTFPQMIAHHTSNGCVLMPGDLLASGTISGPSAESRGCMLELTWAGNGADGKPKPRTPVLLPTGESRTFLEDGDEVVMRGWCEGAGLPRIGFGQCSGIVTPAV